MNCHPMLKRARSFATAWAASMLVLTPVWADDTEIFFADTGAENIWPNVLFIIDTSGSMDEIVYENGVSTGKDRLEQVQDGFRTILNQLSNVNVGLMRFSNPGGPVLYPVFDIDADVSSVKATEVISRVGADNDDAQELADGQMLLNEDQLTLTKIKIGGEYRTYTVTADQRDAEQYATTSESWYDSGDLDVAAGGRSTRFLIGMKFTGLDLPSNAVVTRAQIELTVEDVENTGAIPMIVSAQPDDSGDFSGASNDISGRARTSATVNWTIPSGLSAGDKVLSDDLSTIVKEVISNGAWNAPSGEEDDIVFFMAPDTSTSTGYVEFHAFDGAPGIGSRPTLYLEYYVGAAPTEQETTTGLRFQSLDIPRGVTISSAFIEFTADRDLSGDFTFSIAAEDTGDAAAYSSTVKDISSRATNGASITWKDNASVAAGDVFTSPDIKDLVEDVVGRSDWCGGNDMAFMITGSDGLRNAWSHDGDSTKAPRLVVRYDYSSIPDGTSCYRDEISRRVVASSDDAEEAGSNVSLTGTILNLESGNLVGVRFTELNIPKNATILDARLEFTQREEQDTGSDISINIAVENDSGDAAEFTGSDGTIAGRTYHGSTVTWNSLPDWYDGNSYQSPDIKALVAAAVSNSGWSAGNAIAFKLTTSGSRDRRPHSFNSSPGEAPRLIVEFTADGSGRSTRKVRDELLTVVDNLSHNGWTPIQDTLYEAALYYTGGDVLYGAKRGGPNDSGPHSYTRVSHEASMVPGTFNINYPSGCSEDNLSSSSCTNQTITGVGGSAKYSSPIDNYCQKTSHIVLLTDGFANRDHSASLIRSFTGLSSCTDAGTGDGGACVIDLVKHLKTTDLSSLKLEQNVITHTIGFQFASDWLRDVATQGGGLFARADNADQLVDAINDILIDALKVDNTFVAPVAAVNQFNRLNNLDDIYFAVFRPDEYPRWPGNVKKYKLGTGNEVLDKNGDPAVDPNSGFFRDGSTDLWNSSGNPDGKDVERGGASSNIPGYASRKVYTYHANSTTTVLSDAGNRLHTDEIDSGKLTKAMFGATSLTDGEFDDLVDWIRGKDVPGTTNRNSFNDPLHSRPVAVTYNVSETDPDVEIFVGTNGGGLHAINAKTGVETFIFFPEATLPLQLDLQENRATQSHLYGIDGNIVPWVKDTGANGINGNDGDFVRLFFGMRRGGYNYYSIDVTDRANPKFIWKIEGGTGDFGEMGQTWGTPVRGKIRLKDESAREVLFISGGYDEAKDEYTVQTADTVGRAVYIVDAETGSLIWSGGPSNSFTKEFADMKYSIPSGLTLADVDQDGLDDFFFVGDTGGQVWRFDIAKGAEVADLVTGGVIADLGVAGGANTEARNRRFFHAPDVALVERDNALELAITIGSGFRPSPLSKVTEDMFFMIRQRAVFGPPATYTKLTLANLYDATDNRVGDGVDANGNTVSITDARNELEGKEGWYIKFDTTANPGEKVLSTPLALDNSVTFVTYSPNTSIVDCRAVAGTSRVYNVRLEDATPTINFDDTNPLLNENDRVFTLMTPSIIDEPVVICTGEGCDVFTGAEQPPLDDILNDRITRTYWRQNE